MVYLCLGEVVDALTRRGLEGHMSTAAWSDPGGEALWRRVPPSSAQRSALATAVTELAQTLGEAQLLHGPVAATAYQQTGERLH